MDFITYLFTKIIIIRLDREKDCKTLLKWHINLQNLQRKARALSLNVYARGDQM